MIFYIFCAGEILKPSSDHNHAPDCIKIEVKRVINKVKRKAKNSEDTTMGVIRSATGAVSEEVAAELSSQESMQKRVRNVRKQNIDNFPHYEDLSSMIIPEYYQKTLKNEKFLMYDSGDSSLRFLIYSTPGNLNFLKSCKICICDGTF